MRINKKGGDSKRMKATAIEPCPSRTLLLSTKICKDTKLLIVAMAITTVIAFATGLPGLDLVVKDVHGQDRVPPGGNLWGDKKREPLDDCVPPGGNLCGDHKGVPLEEPGDTTPTCGEGTGIICVPPEYICEKNPHARGCEYSEGLPGDDATTGDDFVGKGRVTRR
jgi:hypothetical protein